MSYYVCLHVSFILTLVACLSIWTAYHARGACAHMSLRFEQTEMAAPTIINRARTGTWRVTQSETARWKPNHSQPRSLNIEGRHMSERWMRDGRVN